jgi:AcrR family transcriptional regulator
MSADLAADVAVPPASLVDDERVAGNQERPAPDRRRRRKAETRQRLLDAAGRLFAERGFEATRPQDIAREADLAVGTFYVHFSDRREAFRAFTAQAADELMELARTRAREGAGFEEWLTAYLSTLLDYADRKPGVVRAAFADEGVIAAAADDAGEESVGEGSLRDRLARGLARGLEAGMERGAFHADYDPLLVSYGMVGLIQQSLTHGAQRSIDRAAVIENITRFCGRALDARPRQADSKEDSL